MEAWKTTIWSFTAINKGGKEHFHLTKQYAPLYQQRLYQSLQKTKSQLGSSW